VAFAAARAIYHERDRSDALAALAPHLASEQLGKALAAAKAIGDKGDRSRALTALAPYLAPEQRPEAFGEALAAAEAVGDKKYRSRALAALAPHLAPEQLGHALAAARAISDEPVRTETLAALAPHLPPERRSDVSQDEGATLDALIAATGWLPHTTRAALTGLRKRGYLVERSRHETKGSLYHITRDTALARA
jgi:Protein of unknown function (DUF3489)